MSISGNYPPSKVVALAATGQPTLTLQASTLWYIMEDEDNPSNFIARYQNPLSPASSGIIYNSFTGVADTVAANLGIFVKVTPDTVSGAYASSFPRVPFWFNVCMFKNLEDQTAYRKLTLGTSNASESLHVTESYASLLAAINTAATTPDSGQLLALTPLGNTQAAARQAPIVRGAGEYTIVIGGSSTGANNGIRLDMLDENGTLIAPVPNTKIIIKNRAGGINAFVNVYPGVGYIINGGAPDAPWVLDRGGNFELICFDASTGWEIASNEFGTIEADAVKQNDDTDYLALGSNPGKGIIVFSAGNSPALVAVALGTTDTGFMNIGQLQAVNLGAVSATFRAGSTLMLGGDDPGEEGNLVSRELTLTATTPAAAAYPRFLITIDGVTGLTPGIMFNGDEGSVCYIRNPLTNVLAVEVRDVANTLIATIAAGDGIHIVSWDGGQVWAVVSTFTM